MASTVSEVTNSSPPMHAATPVEPLMLSNENEVAVAAMRQQGRHIDHERRDQRGLLTASNRSAPRPGPG